MVEVGCLCLQHCVGQGTIAAVEQTATISMNVLKETNVLKEVQTWRVREDDKQFVYFLNEEAMKEHITIEARSSGVRDISFSYSPEVI